MLSVLFYPINFVWTIFRIVSAHEYQFEYCLQHIKTCAYMKIFPRFWRIVIHFIFGTIRYILVHTNQTDIAVFSFKRLSFSFSTKFLARFLFTQFPQWSTWIQCKYSNYVSSRSSSPSPLSTLSTPKCSWPVRFARSYFGCVFLSISV